MASRNIDYWRSLRLNPKNAKAAKAETFPTDKGGARRPDALDRKERKVEGRADCPFG